MKIKMIFYFKNGKEIESEAVDENDCKISVAEALLGLFNEDKGIETVVFGNVIANNSELQAVKMIEAKDG